MSERGATCGVCNGEGQITDPDVTSPEEDIQTIECYRCGGTGEASASDPRPDPRTHPEHWTE